MAAMQMVLCEDACMTTIGDIADELSHAIAEHSSIQIDLTAAGSADLSVLQVIEAARRQAVQADCALSLTEPATPALAALLDRAGFTAAATPADLDFWFHGALPQ